MLNRLILILASLFCITKAIELKLSTGHIEGKTVLHNEQALHVFKKIPFAQPPVAHLRFRKPQPVLKWSGTLNATVYGPSCMINLTRSDINMTHSEDCLHVNVFTSQKCLDNKNCPIMVLFHGGSFVFGAAVQYNDSQIYEKYAQHEIVFVIPAYRVGFFGFIDLGHDFKDAPYNVGLYDILFALEWVQREIHAFGGNSKRVTLMGYSSGATAVQYLLASPKLQDKRLFHQVMISSGLPDIRPGLSRNITIQLLNVTGCWNYSPANTTSDYSNMDSETKSPKIESNHTSIKDQLECLRALSAKELSDATGMLITSWEHLKPQSSKDLFPARNYAQLAEKRKSIPLLVMTTIDEMGNLKEPEDTIEHTCREKLRIFGYEHEATVAACVKRYEDSNDTTPILRDIYHVLSVRECQINSGGVDENGGWSGREWWHRRKHQGEDSDHDGYEPLGPPEKKHHNENRSSDDDEEWKTTTQGNEVYKAGTAKPDYKNRESGESGEERLKEGWDLDDVAKIVKRDKKKMTGHLPFVGNFHKKDEHSSSSSSTDNCWLGIFGQQNHSQHVNEMYYMIGQHFMWYENGNATFYNETNVNDELMDRFYPKMVRNFIRGERPLNDWPSTNKKGKNYFYFSFDVLSENKNDHEFPHPVFNHYFDKEAVEFYLTYLDAIERNASQFQHKPWKHGRVGGKRLGAIAATFMGLNGVGGGDGEDMPYDDWVVEDEIDGEESLTDSYTPSPLNRDDYRSYHIQDLYGYTSLWTIFLLTIAFILFGIVFQMRKQRRANIYSTEPLQPITRVEKTSHMNYQAI